MGAGMESGSGDIRRWEPANAGSQRAAEPEPGFIPAPTLPSRGDCARVQREVQGGVGKRTFPCARSSGQTITFFSFCHWKMTALCAS